MRTWIVTATVAALMLASASAQAAVSASLAKQCREMMVKAYPLTAWGTAVSASAQRAYFQECLKRQGNMDEPTTASDRHGPV